MRSNNGAASDNVRKPGTRQLSTIEKELTEAREKLAEVDAMEAQIRSELAAALEKDQESISRADVGGNIFSREVAPHAYAVREKMESIPFSKWSLEQRVCALEVERCQIEEQRAKKKQQSIGPKYEEKRAQLEKLEQELIILGNEAAAANGAEQDWRRRGGKFARGLDDLKASPPTDKILGGARTPVTLASLGTDKGE